ncbi:hypothetical protein Q1695_010357 [Nippostrongylus brasiliensis]|nr:hypothetical protein Q1695_010357 [Nippostrongylus brasiliensis]
MVNTTEGPSNLVVPTTTTPYSSENLKNETQNSNGSGGSVNLPPVEAPVYPNTTKTPEKISTTTSMSFVGVTQIVNETSVKLDNGDIIITQLIRYPNGTLTYRNITEAGKTPKPEINLPQQSTTSTVLTCPQITVDISNSVSPKQNSPELLGRQSVGTLVVHMCAVSYVFPSAQQPLKIYECMADGNWTRNANGEKCEYVSSRLKNSSDL